MMGNSDLKSSTGKMLDSSEKGKDSFASLVEKAVKPETKIQSKTGNSPRSEKNLSVKDRNLDESKSLKKEEDPTRKQEKEDSFFETSGEVAPRAKQVSTPRQKVMQEFMDSMESEFSIPPERIMEAMTKLSDQDMQKAPEETASQIIKDLDLSPQDSEKAVAMYLAMLGQLSSLEKPKMNMFAVPAQAQAEQGFSAAKGPMPAVVNQKQKRVMLNESLDRMNQKFFMMGPETEKTVESNLMVREKGLETLESPTAYQYNLLVDKKNLANPDLNQKDLLSAQPNLNLSESEKAELESKLAALGISAEALKASVEADPQNKSALKMEQLLKNQDSANGNSEAVIPFGAQFQKAQLSSNLNSDSAGKEFSRNSDGDALEDLSISSKSSAPAKEFFIPQQMESAAAGGNANSTTPLATGALGTGAGANKTEGNQNLQQIMNQAQYAIKKGGGEAIVKLTPEGLGDVHLKVSVHEGKVNLQMAAETKEAKSLIESSINDLKTSLGSHNLKVEHVKVDVGNQAGLSDQGAKSGFQFDQSREQARQFLGNFQEENLANRGGFFEMPGLRSYGAPKKPDPLKAADEASAKSRRYIGEGRGSGLNLVA